MVRDDDAGGPALAGELGVLAGDDPLDHDRQPVSGEPFEVAPAQGRVEGAEPLAVLGEVIWEAEADPQVALAAAEVRRIDGEHERRVAAADGLLDEGLRQLAAGKDVDLEPAARRRARRLRPLPARRLPPRRGTSPSRPPRRRARSPARPRGEPGAGRRAAPAAPGRRPRFPAPWSQSRRRSRRRAHGAGACGVRRPRRSRAASTRRPRRRRNRRTPWRRGALPRAGRSRRR